MDSDGSLRGPNSGAGSDSQRHRALPEGRAGHRRVPVSRRISDRQAGAEPADQPRHRGRRDRAEQGSAAPDGPRGVRPRRHPQPVHRQGHPQRRRRHRRARRGGVLRAALGRHGGAQGTQRDGRDPAVRGLPEGAVGAPRRAQVHVRGVRLEPARPGAVHRGQQSPQATRARASPATASTSRATPAVWAGAGPTSRSRSCGWPT